MFLCNHSLFWEFLLKIILIISKFRLICFYLCIYPSIIYLFTYINICFVGIRWQSRRVCALCLLQELQNYNLLMNNRWLENVSHQKKDIPYPRAKEKLQQDARRGKITIRIKPLTYQRCSEGWNKTCVHWKPGERNGDPRSDWPRLAHECPGVSGCGVDWWWPAVELGALSAAVGA